jgi:hypothetical protein
MTDPHCSFPWSQQTTNTKTCHLTIKAVFAPTHFPWYCFINNDDENVLITIWWTCISSSFPAKTLPHWFCLLYNLPITAASLLSNEYIRQFLPRFSSGKCFVTLHHRHEFCCVMMLHTWRLLIVNPTTSPFDQIKLEIINYMWFSLLFMLL